MDIFRPNTLAGEWFPFGDGEVQCRHIPADVDAAFRKTHYKDRTSADIEKEGGDYLNIAITTAYVLDRACYALVESKNLWAPAAMVDSAMPQLSPPGGGPERRADGMVRLDGYWSDAVKRAVLKETLVNGQLGMYVIDCSKSLAAKVEAKKEALGKA
jgi:hypothetical protein